MDKDTLIIEKIKKELLKYNYFDIMLKLSSLNTLYKNQDSNILISCLINSLIPYQNLEDKPIISISHFKTVLKELDNLSIVWTIDPVENLFFDIVSIDKQYYSYENINSYPSYILNHLIRAIGVFSSAKNNDDFVIKSMSVIQLFLQLQTEIINDSKETNPNSRNYSRKIYFYDSLFYSRIKNDLVINYDEAKKRTFGEIDNLIIRSEEADKELFGRNNNLYNFFAKPLINLNDKLIVLDPTFLTTACNHYILILASRYGLLNELITNYKNSIIYEAELSIRKIDNPNRIYFLESKNKHLDYCLEEFSTKKAMLHIFVTDDESTYEDDSFLSQGISQDLLLDYYIDNTVKEIQSQYDEVFLNLSIITFGRGISIGSNIKLPCIMLCPYQLNVISKRTRLVNNILYYYTKDKFLGDNLEQKIMPNFFGDFNYFIVYDEHDCSFYLDDSFPQKTMNLFVDFDVIYEYVYTSFSPCNNNVIQFDGGYTYIENIENNKYFGVIKEKPSFIVKGKEEYFCAIHLDKNSNEPSLTIAEFLSYWFSEAINFIIFNNHNCFIDLVYSKSIDKYSIYKKSYDQFQFVFGDRDFAFLSIDNHDNSSEKQLFLDIINAIDWNISDNDSDYIFNDKLKKKIYSVDFQTHSFMAPSTNAGPIPLASKSKMSELLDEIGEYFVDNEEYKIDDTIIGDDRGCLCNKIVDYVYHSFVKKVSEYNSMSIIEIAYKSLEKIIPETILRNDNYKNQIHLYPNKEKEIRQLLSEYNANSISLRFILEYVGAIRNKTGQNCDFIDLEELMAFGRVIIDWATASDLFKYEMIDDDIVVLKSKRFGYDKENVEIINNYMSSTQYDYLSKENNTKHFNVSIKEKNEIFNNDFGYSFEEYISILGLIHGYGEMSSNDLKCISFDEWIKLCDKNKIPTNLRNIIDEISITERENYFEYKHYSKREFYPWRFNRLFSMFRKPIIKVENMYYWGNKTLNHNIFYISNLINNGIFNSGKKGNNYSLQYNGIIATKRGKMFNDFVLDIFNSFPDTKAVENITSVNSKHISDEKGNDLGDIDVLAFCEKLKKVFIVETKDYSMARNVNDVSKEIKKLFDGDTNSKPDYEKHMVRYKWVLNHKSDFIKEYNLKNDWEFVPLFVTNQPMVSIKFQNNKNINIIDVDKLNYSLLKKIR